MSRLPGFHQSDEIKRKIGTGMISYYSSGGTPGMSGKVWTEQQRKKFQETWNRRRSNGVARSEERNRKISESLRLARLDPSKYRSGGRILGYFFSTKNNDNIPYRSSYELAYLKQLESDPLVVSYEYEGLRIGYSRSDGKHTTIPDFLVHYIDGHTELVEVKSDWCIDREDVQAKIEAMKRYASEHEWTFKLVTEKELFEEGVEHALAS